MENNGNSKQVEKFIALAALFIILAGTFLVLKPFLSAVIWAAVLTFSLWPVNRRFTKWLRGRRILAALVTTLTIAMLLVVPFVIVGFNLAGEIGAVTAAVENWSAKGPPQTPTWVEKIPVVGPHAKKYWESISGRSAKFTRQVTHAAQGSSAVADANAASPSAAIWPGEAKLTETLGKILIGARSLLLAAALAMGHGVIQVALSLLLMFFMLCDGKLDNRLAAAVVRVAGERGRHLMKVAGDTIRGVIYGILGTAIAQGVLAAVGFAIAGVPGPMFLGLLTFFLSPVPIGPPLVWIPAAIWLFAHGFTGWGIFMLVWGVGVVSMIDNFLKPWLISQGNHMPFILIFFGVIGGALAFGFIGIFLGPSLLAVTYCLAEEWLRSE